MADTNYFVCTLGQASTLHCKGNAKSYRNISDFVSQQADHHPLLPAIGFPIPHSDPQKWKWKVLNFAEVEHGTNVFARRLHNTLGEQKRGSKTVALLCHSSPEFLFTWLGLMRLGYAVLLIAPQCQAGAIMHLCTSCDADVLLHDTAHADRASETQNAADKQGLSGFRTQLLPLKKEENIFAVRKEQVDSGVELPLVNMVDVAYLHHTSGTSSGLPKPIPQSHRAAIGVLPHLPKIPGVATFTTTPLYHGGIADLFRAWASNALIWLFPSKDIPITAQNICNCLRVAKSYRNTGGLPAVGYFSSVPYVLQMMEADDKGLELLKEMDIVGVGGAALPAEVGDRLVHNGVNLISRFGSAECGFVLSSFRDFAVDKNWQYLRNYNPPELLRFEPQEDGLAELVIKPGWPHMAKTNRSDGSFATADLFAPHPNIEDAWLYNSRADSQLTLITGKKFDPAPLEDAIATSPLLDDVLIFGNNRPFPGALLFRSEHYSEMSDQELVQQIKVIVEKLNRESQDHARISFGMLVPMPHQSQPLEKSSKGTIIRRVADSRYEDVINSAYNSQETDESDDVADEDLPQYLRNLIQSVTSDSADLTDEMDLFSYGVDSIACMQLRTRLRRLIPSCNEPLPMSVVEDCGTIRRLTDYIVRKRHGDLDAKTGDEEQLMRDLVKKFGSFEKSASQASSNGSIDKVDEREVVILTGATGALGAHILHLLLKSAYVDTVYCLVRGADEHAAIERVKKALEQRGLSGLEPSNKSSSKVRVIQAQLGQERLGLNDEQYHRLSSETTSIIHVAWTVNFRLNLRSFVKDNIAGVRNLLDLALASPRSSPPRFTYCSSTASILNGSLDSSGCLPETVLADPSSASPLGYSRSKWVAEHICLEAHRRTSLRGRISVVRVGQLTGDSALGVWNTKEAWPIMLSTARLIKCLPDLQEEALGWLPVDIAAHALLDIASVVGVKRDEMAVYHVVNPHRSPSWHEMLQWLQKKEDFDIVEPREWVQRLEESGNEHHSAMKLLGLWKDAYGDKKRSFNEQAAFSMVETTKNLPSMRDVKPLDEAFVGRIWAWIRDNVQ